VKVNGEGKKKKFFFILKKKGETNFYTHLHKKQNKKHPN